MDSFDDRSRGAESAPVASFPSDVESTISLVERARSGDQHAMERLAARHLVPLRRWARGRLPGWARDLADTDDLVQDALFQTIRRIDAFDVRGPGALQAYLRQSVLNRVRDELRRKVRRPESTAIDEVEFAGGCSPLEELIGREALARYERALAALRPEEREAIIGRIEMGYPYEELADALGKPSPDAARKAVERALVRLARLMDSPDA